MLPPLRNGDLGTALRRRFQPHWFAFDHAAAPLEEADLAGLRADGPTTHYAESLTTAWDLLRPDGVAPHRVLLVSDGHDLGSRDIVETARQFGVVIDTLAPTAALRRWKPTGSPSPTSSAPAGSSWGPKLTSA